MAKTEAPPPRLSQLLRYDAKTGLFRWSIRTHGGGRVILPGHVAGTNKDGYVSINLDKTVYRAHRLAWFVMTGDWLPSSQDIDHVNGNRADNRWSNLRLATRSQNNMNVPLRSNNKSGHRGVSWRKDISKWDARIVMGGKTVLLGTYSDIAEAITARKAAEQQHFGEYSFLRRKA